MDSHHRYVSSPVETWAGRVAQWTNSDERALLDSIAPEGVGIASYERTLAELAAFDAVAQGENKVIGQRMALDLHDRELRPVPIVPTSVVIVQENPSAFGLPDDIGFDPQLYRDGRWRVRVERLRSLVRGGGDFVIAKPTTTSSTVWRVTWLWA